MSGRPEVDPKNAIVGLGQLVADLSEFRSCLEAASLPADAVHRLEKLIEQAGSIKDDLQTRTDERNNWRVAQDLPIGLAGGY